MQDSNRNSIVRKTVDEITRAIYRINHPLVVIALDFTGFFTQNPMLRKGAFNMINDLTLNLLVDFSNEIVRIFFGNSNHIRAFQSPGNDGSARTGRFNGNIDYRFAHNV